MFDLNIFPLSLDSGHEQYDLPGLRVLAAPRKAARMRAQDFLVLYLRLVSTPNSVSTAALTFAQQQEILNHLADSYFAFSGSVTAGLRAVATRLNDFLLNRNLKAASEGQIIGVMNMAVIHGESLIVGHCGPTHTFVLGKTQVQHYDDTGGAAYNATFSGASYSQAGRGLGISRNAIPRFYQASIAAGEMLLISPDAPAGWTVKSLANSPQMNFDLMRRRLLGDASGDLHAALIRTQPGKGQVTFWKPGDRLQGDANTLGAQRPSRRGLHRPGAVTARPAPDAPEPAVPQESAASNLAVASDASAASTESAASNESAASTEAVAFHEAASSQPEPQTSGRVEATAEEPSLTEEIEQEGTAPVQLSQKSFEALHTVPDVMTPEEFVGLEDHPAGQSAVFLGEQAGREAPSTPSPRPRAGTAHAEEAHADTARAERRSGRQRWFGGSAAAKPQAASEPAEEQVKAARKITRPAGPPPGERLRRSLASAWRGWHATRQRVGGAISSAAARVLPKRQDATGREIPFFNIAPSAMLMIAIVIPLLVVAVATAVYLRAGRGEQFQGYFLQAQQYAQQAGAASDPAQQRESWTQVYTLVRKAEQFERTDQSAKLRKQAQDALDQLEGMVRLDFQPAVRSDLPRDVNITHIVTTLNDVYLLDSSQGRILRLFRTATGYEIDPNFACGPGKAGAVVVSPLVSLVAMPPSNEPRATVMGIDASGNLVYCSPSMDGFETHPLPLPDNGWGKLTGMTLSGDTLFVLDPQGNAVYYYNGNNGLFEDKPHLYFDEQIPPMADVIDLAVDDEFLYLLHDNGQMTRCDGGVSPTKCIDQPYGDARPGFDPAPLAFPGTRFTQIQTTQPPDPSLFALDVANRAVYHLSQRYLNFQRQYRPRIDGEYRLPNSAATAFAVTPNRRVLLALGNEIFFATIP